MTVDKAINQIHVVIGRYKKYIYMERQGANMRAVVLQVLWGELEKINASKAVKGTEQKKSSPS